ncbi:MAG: hypothetical protein JXA33_09605 [Anaerolineae bacterium]|nr:hypothetical protein [Anaerolineae bacterium]
MKKWQIIGLTASGFMLLFGATYLFSTRVYVWDAALLLIISLVSLFYVFTHTLLPRHSLKEWGENVSLTPLDWIKVATIVVSAMVGFTSRTRVVGHDFTFLLFVWLFAIFGFVVATVWSAFVTYYKQGGLKVVRNILSGDTSSLNISGEFWAVWGLLGSAALVRGIALDNIPFNLGGDEGTQLLAGIQLVTPPLDNPFATGWYSVPTLSFLLYGVGMRVWGATVAGGRMISAIIGTLTVWATFWLGRTMGGKRVAWSAAFVVAFSAYHIHFSRIASNQILDPFIGTLGIGLLYQALTRPVLSATSAEISHPAWGLAGIVLGIGWYAYFGARWVTFLALLIVFWRVFQEPRFVIRHRKGLGTLLGGWLLITLPLLMWYMAHPSAFIERYNAVGIFPSGWLTREVALTGKSISTVLAGQFWRAITAFHLTPDPTFWYRPGTPLVDFVTGGLLLVGMLVSLLRWRWPGRGSTLLWFWSTLVMGWGLTENPPSSQRGLLLVPAVALLVAWGVEAIWELLNYCYDAVEKNGRAIRHSPFTVASILWAVLSIVIMTLNIGFYFDIYTPQRIYGNPSAEVATELAHFIKANPLPGSTVYFFGPPFVYWEFGTLAFLLRDQPGYNVLPDELPQAVVSPARFVFVQERLNELEGILALYPGGDVTQLYAPNGRSLALIYDW